MPLVIPGAYEGRSVQLRGTAFESERLRHFPFMDKWGISVVFIANALRRTPRVCVIPRAVRVYTALARGDSKLRFTITAMEQEREGEIERLRKRQATTPHRPAKRSRLLEAKLPRGNPKRVYSTRGSGQTIPWSALVGSH